MAGRQFLHANSPSEIAKREQRGDDFVPEKPKGFRHYNHPAEVAKRAEEAAKLAARVPAATTNPAAPVASEAKREIVLPSPAAAGAAVHSVPLGTDPAPVVPVPQASAMQRLRDLEGRFNDLSDEFDGLLVDLFGEPEANQQAVRELRVLVLDFPLVKESQLALTARTRALATAIGMEWHPDGSLGPPLEPTPDPPLFPGLDAAAAVEPPTRPDPPPQS